MAPPATLIVILLAVSLLAATSRAAEGSKPRRDGNVTASYDCEVAVPHAAPGSLTLPGPNGDATFTVQPRGAAGRTRASSLCPGVTHTLEVALGSTGSAHVLSTSQGTLGGGSARCPGRMTTDSAVSTVSTTLTIPCSASGSVQLRVIAMTNDGVPLKKSTATFTLDPSCGTCASTATITAATTTVAATAIATATLDSGRSLLQSSTSTPPPAAPADSAMAAFIAKAHAAAGCNALTAPDYGYACNRQDKAGWRLSYTLSTSYAPPDNACTRGIISTTASSALPAGANGWMHVLIADSVTGYTALAWAGSAGQMHPAVAVLGGWRDDQSSGYGGTFTLTETSLPPMDDMKSSWATNLGTGVQSSPDTRTLLCFTRAVALPSSSSSSTTPTGRRRLAQASSNPPDVTQTFQMSYASSSQDGYDRHENTGAYTLNVGTGEASFTSPKLKQQIQAHGVLMILVFTFFMPLAISMAANKAVMAKTVVFSKAIWFWIHVCCQLLAAIFFISAILLAWIRFPGNVPSGSPSDAYAAHGSFGVILAACLGTQLVVGFVRPGPEHRWRPYWNMVHHLLGRTMLLIGLVTVSLGIYVNSAVYGPADGTKSWKGLAAACIALASVVLTVHLVLTFLDARRQSHIASHVDSPRSAQELAALPVQFSSAAVPGSRQQAPSPRSFGGAPAPPASQLYSSPYASAGYGQQQLQQQQSMGRAQQQGSYVTVNGVAGSYSASPASPTSIYGNPAFTKAAGGGYAGGQDRLSPGQQQPHVYSPPVPAPIGTGGTSGGGAGYLSVGPQPQYSTGGASGREAPPTNGGWTAPPPQQQQQRW